MLSVNTEQLWPLEYSPEGTPITSSPKLDATALSQYSAAAHAPTSYATSLSSQDTLIAAAIAALVFSAAALTGSSLRCT